MILDHALQNNFENLLVQTHEYLQQFLKCLENEQVVLEQHNIEELNINTQRKQAFIASLQSTANDCQRILAISNLNFNDGSIRILLQSFDSERQEYLSQLWKDIKNLLNLTHECNLRNGLIISMLKNHNDGLLKLVTKQVSPTDYEHLAKRNKISISTREHKA